MLYKKIFLNSKPNQYGLCILNRMVLIEIVRLYFFLSKKLAHMNLVKPILFRQKKK